MLTDALYATSTLSPDAPTPRSPRTEPGEATLVTRLRSMPLFAALSPAGPERVTARGTQVDVPKGMLLMERAHPGSGVFVILEGTAAVELPGEEISLGPSELVGELSMLADGTPRSARVRAATPLSCLALSRSDFTQLLETEPGFARCVASLVARRLQATADARRADDGSRPAG